MLVLALVLAVVAATVVSVVAPDPLPGKHWE